MPGDLLVNIYYIPAKISDVIKVVYKNFFKILGFFGAPGSLHCKLFLKGFITNI